MAYHSMIHKFSADIIYSGDGEVWNDVVIIADDNGIILEVGALKDHDPASIRFFKGILLPGMINTHCHLELSHMKGKIDTGTGLISFINQVVRYRESDQQEILSAIEAADSEMYENGIVAVGDISNKADTADIKSRSKLDYYTFVEFFDLMQPALTAKTIAQYKEVFDKQSTHRNNKKSMVPHAPYSVTKELFAFIRQNQPEHVTVSIHIQETMDEMKMFLDGSGGFIEFYENFGLSLSHFSPTGQSSIHYAMENMNPANPTLFIHNTLTGDEDIEAARHWNQHVFWATCPNANLYIENRLPDYRIFMDAEAKVTLGTDSLTSNWQLSVWEEMKTIRKYCSYVPLEDLVVWACINGAQALGYADRLGSIRQGKTPGIVWVECAVVNGRADIAGSQSVRVI